jgi:hypothetical protein
VSAKCQSRINSLKLVRMEVKLAVVGKGEPEMCIVRHAVDLQI